MSLLELWAVSPSQISKYYIEQIVAMADDGNLRDGSKCSDQLRQYLAQIDIDQLSKYIERCLTNAFPKSGQVLQDLVNELGRRLDYSVTNGRYSGVAGQIGFDGIWTAPDNHGLVVEVKTTDAYRVSLDTLAAYRAKLIERGDIAKSSSILLVVGRQETGELEAQIRGSRHAWDIRVIGIDSLTKLAELKQETDNPETVVQIRTVLAPFEYTKLDRLVEVIFATAKDVSSAPEQTSADVQPDEASEENADQQRRFEFTDSAVLDAKRSQIVAAFSAAKGTPLIKKSRAVYWNPTQKIRIVCTISKRYLRPGHTPYWYAFHPKWKKFFEEEGDAYFVLGCMDLPYAFAIPAKVLFSRLDELNVTEKDDRFYWHIKLIEDDSRKIALQLPKTGKQLDLSPYQIALKPN